MSLTTFIAIAAVLLWVRSHRALKRVRRQLFLCQTESGGRAARIGELEYACRTVTVESAKQNNVIAELEGERDELRRRLDNIDWASIADEKQAN